MLIRSITQNATDKKLFEILTVENVGIDTKTKYTGIMCQHNYKYALSLHYVPVSIFCCGENEFNSIK